MNKNEPIIYFESEKFLVKKVLRHSNARYAEGIHEGDIICFKFTLGDNHQFLRGKTRLRLNVFSYDDIIGDITAGDYKKMFEIFELERI